MIVSIIVALQEDRGIGIDNGIPWRLRSDMKRFKALTTGHHLIMGRKTFESVGKPLPNRTMIVLSRNQDYTIRHENCLIADDLDTALHIVEHRSETEVFICGGEAVYDEGLKVATKLYLTEVHANVVTDTHFPYWYRKFGWLQQRLEYIEADADNQYPSTFKIYIRR